MAPVWFDSGTLQFYGVEQAGGFLTGKGSLLDASIRQDRSEGQLSQPQSITQKGVHTHWLIAESANIGFLQHFSHFQLRFFGDSMARTPFCAILLRSPSNESKKEIDNKYE